MSSTSKSNNIKVLVMIVCILTFIVATTLIINKLNEVPDNDPTVVGNTAGNLNNGGYFCEDGDTVFFANPYDNGYLYSMNADQTKLKKLYNSSCSTINAGGDHLYFCMETPEGGTGLGFVIKTSGIYRSTKKGTKTKCLTNDNTLIMTLVGSNLYYQAPTGKGVGLKKISINGKDNSSVVEDSFVINPACAVKGSLFFAGTTNDHYLYSLNTANDSINTIWDGNIWNPVYEDGYFYYMDVSDKYSLCRFSPATQTIDILTHDRVDTFNVGYGYIYYSVSVGDNPGLYRMRLDGSNVEKVAGGVMKDINITSTYTYFRQFDSETPLYCVPTAGANYVSEFTAAIPSK